MRALEALGASVSDLSAVGGGVPDLLVGFRGRTFLIEVKTAEGTLTPDQVVWHGAWRGHKAIVRTVAEAVAALFPAGGRGPGW